MHANLHGTCHTLWQLQRNRCQVPAPLRSPLAMRVPLQALQYRLREEFHARGRKLSDFDKVREGFRGRSRIAYP